MNEQLEKTVDEKNNMKNPVCLKPHENMIPSRTGP